MASEPDLLITAGFSDAKLAQETQKVVQKYKQMGDAAEKAFRDASGAVTDTQKLRAHMREIDRLSRAYDPVYVATKKYEGAIKQLDRALELGRIDQAKYNDELKRAQTALHNTANGIEEVGRKGIQGGTGLGNLGFQIQDFAVQVGAGTSATQAFAQQFPQLASGFGPLGIALGTAAAIIVPLGGYLLSAGDSAEAMDDKLKDLESTTDAMTAAAEANAMPISELRIEYGALADEVARVNGAMAALTALSARQNLLGTANSAGRRFGNLQMPDLPVDWTGKVDINRQRAAQRQQEQAMASLRRETGATEEQAERLRMALYRLETSNSVEAVARDAENLLAIISELALNPGADTAALASWGNQIQAIFRAAEAQINAGAQAEQRLFDQYDQHTQDLKRLADDRETAEAGLAKAVQDGNQDKIDSYRRVIEAIDSEAVAVGRNINEISGKIDGFIERMAGQARRIGGALNSAIEGYLGWSPAEFGADAEASKRGIRELIKKRESGGNYNATLDNGAYTGGQRDLVNMTINEVLQMQREMLRHPANKKNSSAAGAYQIVGRTLQSLVDELGLTGNELYDPAMQDRLADQLIRRRRGQGIEGLRNEWEGLRNVAPALIQQALGAESIPLQDREVEQRNAQALKEQAAEQERKLNLARQLSEQLSKNLITEQQSAELARQRNEQVASINASGMSDQEKAAAIAQVNAEMERQRTIMMLTEDAKRRGVDLDAQMVNSTLTYRDAINQLGDARAQQVIADQQAAAAADRLKQAQDFAAQQTQALKNGIVDAIVEGENFADVLANVAQALAKAALQAALFGDGPFAGNGGGGLLGNIFSGGLGAIFGGARAMGGPVSAGSAYLVGERGPEIIVPPSAGHVIPNHKLGGSTFAPQTSIVIQGNADERTIALMQRELDARDRRLERLFPSQFARTSRDPLRR